MRSPSGPSGVVRAWFQVARSVRLSERELLWGIVIVSLLWRLLAWAWVVEHDVRVRSDEYAWFLRAGGFATILRSFAGGDWPGAVAWVTAYGGAHWTPLHPLLLSLGVVLDGSVASARLVMVVVSSATTALVYALTRRVASGRAALVAAGIHACYPTFVAYAHYLWAETSLACFLVVALIFALKAGDADSARSRQRHGALAGLMTGVCYLIKPSVIFLVPVVPVWLLLRTRARSEGARAAAAFLLAWLIPWGAWAAGQRFIEGRAIVSMSNSGWGLYLGNNPWIPPGVGTYVSPETKARMNEAVSVVVGQRHVHGDEAAQRLALEEIWGHPFRFAARAAHRIQEYWFPDNCILQHLYRGYYPPLPQGWAAAIGVVVTGAYVLLMALVLRGFLVPGVVPRDVTALWLGIVLASMLPCVLVVAEARYHMPSLVILLPFAALLVDRARLPRRREIAWISGVTAFALICAAGLPTLLRFHTRPSSYYHAIFRPLQRFAGVRFVDQVSFRSLDGAGPKRVTFTLLGGGAGFHLTGTAVASWDAAASPPITGLIWSDVDAAPVRMKIAINGDDDQSVVIQPVSDRSWRRWQPVGLGGLEYRWDPTSDLVPISVYFPSWPDRTQ